MKFRKKVGIYKEATKQVWKEMPLKQKVELVGFATTPIIPPLGIMSGVAYMVDEYMRLAKENEKLKKKLGEVV
jgi:hypothetical protein